MLKLLRRLQYLLWQRRFEAELAEEIETHRAMRQHDVQARGVGESDARAESRRALGNVTLAREDVRRVWVAPWIEGLLQDVRYAMRAFARQPLHSITAGIVLVLGIGLSTALFTLFKALALESWPVPQTRSVLGVGATLDGRNIGPSVDEYRFAREHVRSFTGLAAFSANYPERLRAQSVPEVSLRTVWVSGNFFDVLGVRMHIGGGFSRADDADGGARAPLVLGYAAWRRYFGGDPAVIGRPVFVDGKPMTVVGVVEEGFVGNGRDVDLWIPLSLFAALNPSNVLTWDPSPGSARCCIGVVGRLAPGSGRRAATEEMQVLHDRFSAETGKRPGRVQLFGTAPVDGPGAQRFAVFGAFAAAVALILVLACANVGNLQLARGMARRREIATRLSIGASRARVVRQMLTEGMVLALAAGAASMVVAVVAPRLLFQWMGEDIPLYVQSQLGPDPSMLVFVIAVCTAACLVFALAPALHATRVHIPLGTIDRGFTPSRHRLRGLLLATQIGACTVLLAGAGLLTRGIVRAMNTDLGYEMDVVDMITVTFPSGTPFRERASILSGALRTADETSGTPVALAQIAPASAAPLIMSMALPNRSALEYESVLLRPVTSAYFDVLEIPVIRGRMFPAGAAHEAVVNESFVRQYWPGEEVIGKMARHVDGKGGIRQSFTIVGVVKDTYLTGLDRIDPVIFTPTDTGIFLSRGGAQTFEHIRSAVLARLPSVIVTREPLRQSLRKHLAPSRGGATLAWALGLLGLALAAVGIFGVFSYAVEERRREIGIRLALGAAGGQIIRLLVASSGRALLLGLGAGLILSLACGPVLRKQLFGLHPLDPIAYAGVIALLGVVATLSTLVPARRACRVDPAITLRED